MRQVHSDNVDGVRQLQGGRWDCEGIRHHAVWARITYRLMVIIGIPIAPVHRMIHMGLRERFDPYFFGFGQSLRTDPDHKVARIVVRRHPPRRDDIRQHQRHHHKQQCLSAHWDW